MATDDASVPRHGRALGAILAVALPLVVIVALASGPADVGVGEVASVLRAHAHLGPQVDRTTDAIVWDMRLPRVVLALVTGAALSLAGVAFQTLLRNPLADPFIIGVSSGASLAASLALAFGTSALVPPAGFIGGLVTVYVVYRLALEGGEVSVRTMLLAGVVVSSFLSSCTTLLLIIMGRDMHKVVFWLMGSLEPTATTVGLIPLVTLATVFGGLVLMAMARDLNLLLLGEDHARHLGCDVSRTKTVCFVCASLLAGVVVSVTGLIGFVGLVVPHMVRLIAGPDNRVLLPHSAALGGIFLVLADLVARTAISPEQIPVGTITGFVGGPFFLYLLVRSRRV